MGERQDQLTTLSPEAHEQRIEGLREEITSTVDELKRRAREATDIRLQVRRHPAVIVATGLAVLAMGLGFAIAAARRRRASARMRRFLDALAVLRTHPERLAAVTPSPTRKAIAAAAGVIATTAARRLTHRLLEARNL